MPRVPVRPDVPVWRGDGGLATEAVVADSPWHRYLSGSRLRYIRRPAAALAPRLQTTTNGSLKPCAIKTISKKI